MSRDNRISKAQRCTTYQILEKYTCSKNKNKNKRFQILFLLLLVRNRVELWAIRYWLRGTATSRMYKKKNNNI